MKKEHTYPPYENNFDDLCDAGCGRPVPSMTDGELWRKGWAISDDSDYIDGKLRVCPVCVDEGKT